VDATDRRQAAVKRAGIEIVAHGRDPFALASRSYFIVCGAHVAIVTGRSHDAGMERAAIDRIADPITIGIGRRRVYAPEFRIAQVERAGIAVLAEGGLAVALAVGGDVVEPGACVPIIAWITRSSDEQGTRIQNIADAVIIDIRVRNEYTGAAVAPVLGAFAAIIAEQG
jgi:hypothetical protein